VRSNVDVVVVAVSVGPFLSQCRYTSGVDIASRTAADCTPLKPLRAAKPLLPQRLQGFGGHDGEAATPSTLYSMEWLDNDYCHRELMSRDELQQFGGVLLGRPKLLSPRKLWALLACAAREHECGNVEKEIYRFSRRKLEPFEGESGDSSGDDSDSDNEFYRERKAKYASDTSDEW
jgi:hypothetical protein